MGGTLPYLKDNCVQQDLQFLEFEVCMLLTRVLGLLYQQKLIRDQTRNSGKALLGPLLQQGEREQATGSLARFLGVGVGAAGSLYGGEVVVCPGVGPEG